MTDGRGVANGAANPWVMPDRVSGDRDNANVFGAICACARRGEYRGVSGRRDLGAAPEPLGATNVRSWRNHALSLPVQGNVRNL